MQPTTETTDSRGKPTPAQQRAADRKAMAQLIWMSPEAVRKICRRLSGRNLNEAALRDFLDSHTGEALDTWQMDRLVQRAVAKAEGR